MPLSELHPEHCCDGCSRGASSSSSAAAAAIVRRRIRRRRAAAAVVTAFMLTSQVARTDASASLSRRREAPQLSELIRRRAEYQRRDPSSQTEFDVNVTPPQTCEVTNVTFNTAGGQPPYSVFIGFENWYAYSKLLPASYADRDVSTWLYQFVVPYFGDKPGFSPTPHMLVTVADSTGRLLNSSSLQQVQQINTNCPPASETLPFTFYTENGTSVCSDVSVFWSQGTGATAVTAPLDLYLLPSQQPPVHYPITNVTTGSYNFTLAVQAGSTYMLTMNGPQGNAGVSGINLAGIDEYVGQQCLTSTTALSFAMPTPTATLAADVRMPDFSGVVSSIVTSNGVVATATSVQVVKHGSLQGSNLGTGEIAGLAVGIAVVAAIVAAVLSWCLWRRRHGRQTVFWDVPRAAEGELSKSTINSPIDRRYLQSVTATRQASSNGSMTAPMLSRSPQSDTSDERERRNGGRQSEVSFGDLDSQANGTFSSVRYSNRGSGFAAWNSLDGSINGGNSRYNSVPTLDSGHAPAYSVVGTPRRPSSGSSAGGTRISNPFIERFSDAPPLPSSSARAYRPRSEEDELSVIDGSGIGGGGGTGQSEFFEVLPMVETRHQSSSSEAASPGGGRGATMTSTRPSTGGHASSVRSPPSREVVQHRDAGLLMDDSLDDEDLMGRIELPPSYHQIQRPGRRDPLQRDGIGERSIGGVSSSSRPSPAAPANLLEEELDLGSGSVRQEENEDESEFWRTPAEQQQR